MIGGLLYLTTSRPDIMQAIYLVARFHTNLKQSNEQDVKRFFGYLKGTLDFDLWYKKNGDFMIKSYTDADWAIRIDDKKNTSGIAFFRR